MATGAEPPAVGAPGGRSGWTFLTHHGHVLLAVSSEPDLRVRELASRVGITERAALLILGDLVAEGYVERSRVGRRTHYTVHGDRPLRHPTSEGREVASLLRLLGPRVPA